VALYSLPPHILAHRPCCFYSCKNVYILCRKKEWGDCTFASLIMCHVQIICITSVRSCRRGSEAAAWEICGGRSLGREREGMKINLEVGSDHWPADCLPCGTVNQGSHCVQITLLSWYLVWHS
jgi:hypothetical protein